MDRKMTYSPPHGRSSRRSTNCMPHAPPPRPLPSHDSAPRYCITPHHIASHRSAYLLPCVPISHQKADSSSQHTPTTTAACIRCTQHALQSASRTNCASACSVLAPITHPLTSTGFTRTWCTGTLRVYVNLVLVLAIELMN